MANPKMGPSDGQRNGEGKRPDYFKTVGEWILLKKGIFTLDQIVREKGIPRLKVRVALYRLRREKLVSRFFREGVYESKCRNGEAVEQAYYRLADRKRLTERLSPKTRQGTAVDRMWKIIRYKKRFTRRDLVILGEATKENAKYFTKILRRKGIIAAMGAGGPGMEWRLVKDPGPQRPNLIAESAEGAGKERD